MAMRFSGGEGTAVREAYERGRRFVLKCARPIDHARWGFFFEGASAESVLDTLSVYQNRDGGFGSALEPDFWNPNSSPIQTWSATEVIHSLHFQNAGHPILSGILHYLDSGVDFNGRTWRRTIPTNNDFPHAEWWSHSESDPAGAERTYNPTAALAGFALQFSSPDSRLQSRARQIANEAFEALLSAESVEDHELSCFLRLYQCAIQQEIDFGVDLKMVGERIDGHADAALTRDASKWSTEYVCRPSRFIRSREDRLFAENEEIVRYEVEFLLKEQQEDGSWPVTWHWSSYPEAWPVAQAWWKSILVIENLRFLLEMGMPSKNRPG